MLRAEGPSWTGRTLEIGDAAASHLHNAFSGLVLPVLRAGIPPPVVVVCARTQDDGTCELVLGPQATTKGSADDRHRVGPRIDQAGAADAGVNGLVHADEPRPFVRDVSCPAFSKQCRQLRKALRQDQG